MGLLSLGVMVASPGMPRIKHRETVLGYRVTMGFKHRVPFKIAFSKSYSYPVPPPPAKTASGKWGGQSEEKAAQVLTTFSSYFKYGIFELTIY